jgi:hypothetical protein
MRCYHYFVMPNTGRIEPQVHELWLPISEEKLTGRPNIVDTGRANNEVGHGRHAAKPRQARCCTLLGTAACSQLSPLPQQREGCPRPRIDMFHHLESQPRETGLSGRALNTRCHNRLIVKT